MQGKVKFYNDERGFGFIALADGEKDTFFHHSALLSPGTPQEGATVEFDLEQQPDGRTRAKGVRVLR